MRSNRLYRLSLLVIGGGLSFSLGGCGRQNESTLVKPEESSVIWKAKKDDGGAIGLETTSGPQDILKYMGPRDREHLKLLAPLAVFARNNLDQYIYVKNSVLGQRVQLARMPSGNSAPSSFTTFFDAYRERETFWRQTQVCQEIKEQGSTADITLKSVTTADLHGGIQGGFVGFVPTGQVSLGASWNDVESKVISASQTFARKNVISQRQDAHRDAWDRLVQNEKELDAALSEILSCSYRLYAPYVWDESAVSAYHGRPTPQGRIVRDWIESRSDTENEKMTVSPVFPLGDSLRHIWKTAATFTSNNIAYTVESDIVFLKTASQNGQAAMQFDDIRVVRWKRAGGAWVNISTYVSAIAAERSFLPISDQTLRGMVEKAVAHGTATRMTLIEFVTP